MKKLLISLLFAVGLCAAPTTPINNANIQLNGVSQSGVLAANATGAANVTAAQFSAALDLLGSAARGDILYRGASGWVLLPPSTAGFTLTTNGAGADPSWTAEGHTGTVTSVGLSLPNIFTVTNSPVTSSGTLTGTLNTQSANLVWAGPTTGSAAAPTFRSLVVADIPALPYSPSALTNTHIFVGNASNVATDVAMSGDATIANTGALTLANTAVSANSYGSSTSIPSFTVDSKGRLTAASGNVVVGATSTIVDDTTTNATMYPTWVTANTGNLPIKVSSTKEFFNPSTGLNTSTAKAVNGTGGAGYFEGANQSAAPSTPTSAGRLFWDASNRLSWKGTNGYVRTFDGTANTADHVYTLQDQDGTVSLIQGLDITYTGTPLYPININGIANGTVITGTNPGRKTYMPLQGVSMGFLNYNEANTTWPDGQGITSITFHNVVQAGGTGGITFDSTNQCTSISWPALVYMQNSYSPSGHAALTTLSLPNLAFVGGNFAPITLPVLTTLDTPSLVSIKQAYSPSVMAALTTLTANNLVTTGGSFAPATMASLTTLSFPALVNVGGFFAPNTMASLTTWSFPNVKTIGGNFNPNTFGALTSLTMPALVYVGLGTAGGTFNPSTMASLTTLSAPNLTSVNGTFNPSVLGSLTSLTFNALQTITGAFSPSTMASCTTVSLSGMVNYGSTITIPSASMASVSTLTLGTVGTLKSIGGNITLSGLALNSTSVDNCLALVASLDGTSGTTSWGTGKTITLNGGTNASPTTTGTTTQTSAGSNFSAAGTTCTANVTSHGLTTGDIITVTGITTLTNANVTAATVTVVNANQFTYPIASQTATGAGTATMHSTHSNGTDGFHYCQVIRLRGATVTTALGY